ncbi:MAG: hypothetical protein H6719_21060 [Sandaracinaceae bacterium]|nr:hypothetical protein [Sandaracinaceae bacterium]
MRRRALPTLLLLLVVTAVAGVVTAQPPTRGARPRPAQAAPRTPPREEPREHPSFTSEIPCSACHTPEGWAMPGGSSGAAGGFDHARTGFPLRDRHLAAGCTDCHQARRQMRRDCVGCHQDGHEGRLGDDCSRCHTATGWNDTDELEAHRLTRLPLTGMHAIAACTDCHRRTGDRSFSAVPSTCISCHENEYRDPGIHPAHDGSDGNPPFPRQCEGCHRTSGWSPAIVDPSTLGGGTMPLTEAAPARHELRFPIRVGPHQGAPCASCHESPQVPTAVRCVGCHSHSPARLQSDHRTVRVGPDGRGCLGCHPGGMAR